MGIAVLIGACGDQGKAPPGDAPDEEPPGMRPDEEPPPVLDAIEGMRSGSRLKLRWDDFGGARSFTGLFDKQRDEVCSPVSWDDGKTYCTPESEGTVVYQDAQCTMPMGHLPSSCTTPPAQPYFRAERPNADCSRGAPISLHRGTPNTQSNFFRLFAGACVYGGSADPGRLYDLGPEIPSSELVELAPAPRTGDGRLALQYGEASDGARVLLHVRDVALGVACEELMLANDRQSLRCRPSSGYSFSAHADAACQRPLQNGAGVRSGLAFLVCAAKPYTLASSETCAGDVKLLRTGARFLDPFFYGQETCSGPHPQSPGEVFYETTDPVSMAQLLRTPVAATGARLAPVRFADGGIRTQTDVFYDTQLETECHPTRLSDGAQRCLPAIGAVVVLYADASCQTPIELVFQSRGCMAAPVSSFVTLASYSGCQRELVVRSVGESYLNPLYQRAGASCNLVEPDADAYLVGEAVPLEQFAVATPVVEP